MAEKFSHNILRIAVAQLSQAVGFDSIQTSSLDVLTNVLERYMLLIGKCIHDFSEQRGQTIPHLGDVDFALQRLHISLADILDYTRQMEPIEFAHSVAKFPAPKESNLRFPTGNNPEDFNRDEHIPLYMPSMVATPEKASTESGSAVPATDENQQAKKGTFVIAGKHSQGSSSDEDDYSAGEVSNEEYLSDDSLAHNPIKSRHLTKPEDIPTIEGTAPSSLMSMPSSAELDELRGSLSPTRRSGFDFCEDPPDRLFGKERRTSTQTPKFGTLKKTPSLSKQELPWLTPDKPFQSTSKWKTPDSNQSKVSDHGCDPEWLSQKKKTQDIYDPGWLHDSGASPVHLSKPPTPDVSLSNPTEKRPWLSKDKEGSNSDLGPAKSAPKKHSSSKHKASLSVSTPFQKQQKPSAERKLSHLKSHKPGTKSMPSVRKDKGESGEEPIKAKIEAAERLLHSAPVPAYQPSSPRPSGSKPHSRSATKSPVRSSIEKAEKLLKNPPVENLTFSSSRESSPSVSKREKVIEKQQEEKLQDRSNFASSKSMYDAIDAVINRVNEETVRLDEEARKKAEEADLMKFSHLVQESSSSDSEPDVSEKAEEMLQLSERGLQKAQPPTPSSSPLLSPSSGESPPPLGIDEDVAVIDSDSDASLKIPPKKSYDFDTSSKTKSEKSSKKEKHKKKSKERADKSRSRSPHKFQSSFKSKKEKHHPKPASFVTTQTISEKPVKMKVKLKFDHKEPKLFDVMEDRDRIKVHTSKSSKEDKQKLKEGKHHKVKEHKKHPRKLSSDLKQLSGEPDKSVEKIILKKSKSGDAKVVKPKVKEHNRSPSPPSPVASRSNLPVPKLSAAVPVMSVTAVAKDKDKKKSKKEKKKKKDKDKEREMERDRCFDKEKPKKESKDKSHQREKYKDSDRDLAQRKSFDSDISSPMVPKLTLKMGANEKKFVVKQGGSGVKSVSSKKRSHSSVEDNPIPAKDRKVSVESVKTVSGGFAAAVERKVITQTISAGPVGVYEDDDGNKIWICPGCKKPDDGSPMIGCDTCDDWYHWPCVGIVKEPPDDQDWYCPRCIKRQQLAKGKPPSKKRKKK